MRDSGNCPLSSDESGNLCRFNGIRNDSAIPSSRVLTVQPIMSYGNRSSGLFGGWPAARVEQKTEEPTGDAGRCRDGAGSGSSCRGPAGGAGCDLSWKAEEAGRSRCGGGGRRFECCAVGDCGGGRGGGGYGVFGHPSCG